MLSVPNRRHGDWTLGAELDEQRQPEEPHHPLAGQQGGLGIRGR